MTGEHLARDIVELIRLMQLHEVRFVLVGGEAVIYYGYPRVTGDVDFFYERSIENTRRLFAALEEFWAGPVPGVERFEELMEPGLSLMFGRPPNRVDLLNRISGVDFDEAWTSRVLDTIHAETEEIPLPIIGLQALIKNKQASARNKDLDDVEHLTSIDC